LYAQTFGEITGRLTDSTAAVVPVVSVTLTNVNTNAVRSTLSTEVGGYTFPSVAPGSYRMKAELPGFRRAATDQFEVQVQQTVRLDFVLQVGEASETVEVVATSELLPAETATVGTVVENKIINELPLNGRQYLGLVALAPNANTLSPAAGQAGSRQGGDRANQAISTGGQRIMFDYYTLDGVNNTDPNFNTYIVLPSIDAIQEFKVQIGVYPAEFGHQSTQINVLTKSGGNAYHGSLFEFLRNDALDAQPYAFTSAHPPKSPFKWNDYGFEMDGPVQIPKLYDGHDASVIPVIGSKQTKLRGGPPRPAPFGEKITKAVYFGPKVTSIFCFLPVTDIFARPKGSRARSSKTSSRLKSFSGTD
jgi:hypothetical protein